MLMKPRNKFSKKLLIRMSQTLDYGQISSRAPTFSTNTNTSLSFLPLPISKSNTKNGQQKKTINISLLFLRIGLVESNIRKLVNDLERNEYILIAHVNVDSIELDPAEEGQRQTKVYNENLINLKSSIRLPLVPWSFFPPLRSQGKTSNEKKPSKLFSLISTLLLISKDSQIFSIKLRLATITTR